MYTYIVLSVLGHDKVSFHFVQGHVALGQTKPRCRDKQHTVHGERTSDDKNQLHMHIYICI